ncbi:unnamed protein product, partial [Choristocarpus tenellus]
CPQEEKEGIPKADNLGVKPTLWHPRAHLYHSSKGIRDIMFAPRHLGLKIAAASGDGQVRSYSPF